MARVTINDVAREAGVSKKTVSHVLNGIGSVSAATRARVQAATQELGFVPSPQARALALGHSALLLLVHDGSDAESLGQIQQGAETALAGSGHLLAIHALRGGAPDLISALERHRPAGVILLPPLSDLSALTQAVRQAGCRFAALSTSAHEASSTAIRASHRLAAADAAGYLLALGHRRIGFVSGPDESPLAQERELGFIEAMTGFGADIVASGDFTFASGVEAGHLLLELSPHPTAILAANDEMAGGVIMAASARGMAVPQDLSIMGIGGSELSARLAPPLSTMRVPLAELGHRAVRQLLGPDVLAASAPALPCELIPRGSTAPAPT